MRTIHVIHYQDNTKRGAIFSWGSMWKNSLVYVQLIHPCLFAVNSSMPKLCCHALSKSRCILLSICFKICPERIVISGVLWVCVGSSKTNLGKSSYFWILHHFEFICNISRQAIQSLEEYQTVYQTTQDLK